MKFQYKLLSSELFARVAQALARHGFEPKPRTQSIIKRTPIARHCFHLAFIKHASDFDVTGDVAIGFDGLELLLDETQTDEQTRDQSIDDAYSLGAELGNIKGDRQLRWSVRGPHDVECVTSGIVGSFEAIGLPYLEKYSSLREALEALSGDDRSAWLHSPVHGQRAKRALGLAYLLGEKTIFEELSKKKAEFLRARSDVGLNSFLEFKARLETRLAESSGS